MVDIDGRLADRRKAEAAEETTDRVRRISSDGSATKVRAWGIPTRAFHWTLVGLIVGAYLTRHYGDDELFWHRINGYGVLTLVVYRILWGFVGGSTARFKAFLYWPWTALKYGYDFLTGRPRQYLGHNPLGSWLVFAMLGVLGVQGVLGLFSNDDVLAEGPLVGIVTYDMSAYLTKLHLNGFDAILILIAVHVGACFVHLFWQKENLFTPMITGRKKRIGYEDQSEARFGSPIIAVICLLLAAVVVFGSIILAGGAPLL